MKLIFPFKNIATNTLLGFLNKEKAKDFVLFKQDKYGEKHPFRDNYFEGDITYFKNSLPNFENEILQIINTTNQATIDSYFSELIDNVKYISEQFSLDNVKQSVENWNAEELKSYEEQVEKDTEQYFSSEDRKKKHLEEYETWGFGGLFGFGLGSRSDTKKIKRINYNFFCIEKQPDLIDEDFIEAYHHFLVDLGEEYLTVESKYGIPYSKGEIKTKVEQTIFSKPVIFVEGEHDITYIIKAAELLNQNELLNKVELRQRGGWSNLDKLWTIYKDNNWETIPQKKLLLYDCDTKKQDEETGDVYKRVIKTVPENIITKGIENLFPNSIIEKAIQERKEFIDITKVSRIKRGISSEETIQIVNEDEKKNLCVWICKNGSAEDFANFQSVFDLIAIIT